MKKLFSRCSWLITVLICLGILFSVKTFAKDSAADDSLSGSLGKNITWTLEGSSDSGYTIRISGSGDTPDYDYTSDIPWYSHINEIKSVIVEDGITGLGKSSFYKSTSIQSVKLADSVRSIGEMCFFRNGSLEKIELGNGLTSIGEAAFSVSNLKKVSLPIGITHIESDTFYGCKQLESINLEHVKSIGRRAFYFCSNLSGINLSADIEQLEYAAFRGCSSIDKVNIGSKLSELSEQVFAECSSLKEIYIPDNITAIQKAAFYECTALGQVTGAKNVEVLGEMAFNGAKSLETYPFGNKVRSIGNSAFSGCSSFKIDKIPDSVTFMGTWAFGSTAIETIEFGSGLTYINSYAFSYCSNLTKVTFPSNIESIKIYAFSHCPKLKNVIFTEGLKTINEGAFTGSIIKEAVIPKSVSAIGSRAFPDSTKLTLLNNKLTNMGENTYKVIHKAKASFYYNYDYAYEVLELVNKIRKENNLEPMTMDVDLLDNAMYRASELALYFSHQSPMGFTAIGTTENCALGQKTPQKVVDAWMSDEHKYPILSSDFTAIGIGAAESNGQLHWTQEFLSKVSEEAMQSSYKNGNQINTIKYTTDIVNNFYPEQELVKIKEKGNSSIVSILKRAVLLPDSVHYVSSDEKVCTVSKDGKLTGKEAGNATITIYAADSADEYALQTTVQVEVQHNWQSKYTIDKEPTCTENGSQSIHCDVCNTINQDRVRVIKATGHKWSDWEVTKEASETEEGSRRRVCENDKTHVETEVIPVLAHVHKLTKTEAKKASCTENGNKEYYVCSGCKKLFADADAAKEINKEDTVIKATGHKWSAWEVTKEASETEEGSRRRVCENDKTHVETEVIPVLAHVHKLTKTEAKKASCTENGNKEYYVCSGCKKLFADADAAKEINKEDTVIKATGHKAEKIAGKAATYTENGLTEGSKCSICGTVIVAQKVIPKKDIKGDVKNPTSVNRVEKKITGNRSDGDIKDSTFNSLQLRAKKAGKNYINLSWTKVKGASGYIIYGNRCNSNGKVYPLRKVISTAKMCQKIMKLKKGTYYKYVVIAYKMTGAGQKVIASSKTIHVATAGGKVGNYKKVKLNKKIVKLKCGKVFKIKAEQVPEKKKLKVKRHRDLCFESSNPAIAAVSASGRVKAKKKGRCVIYVYSQSGTFNKMTVRVK
ncbi:leucine-rich repeat protein [Anaerobutyricum soehngenii]|uniref:leucine-rich repeat protein n=1 Tax=Anaerobutyricum soehngenii TaxID=105843 RepID=UPI001C104D97|nr:leucine-rich repeat protein [Anaerobutyricum soehngenii]MBU5417981.1 leucine-rich repeat protein [Anaerobutyricum soehngenii]